MRLITLFLSFSLFTTSAMANSGLKDAFDDLSYAVTVEWDQQDNEFYSSQVAAFHLRISELKDQGMTNEQMASFVLSSLKNKKASEELAEMLDLLNTTNMTIEQTGELVDSYLLKHFSQGASWNGRAVSIGVGAVLVVAVILAVSGYDGTHRLTRGTKS